ncbi:MAG: hypothetical protein ACJ77D_05735 [Chloroflexota bacterium]
MKSLGIALIAAATVIQVLACVYVVNAHTTVAPASELQDHIVFRGGVIRIGASIYLHDNATHASSGIRKLTLENCNLVIWTDVVDESQEQIIQADAEEDETLSRLQVQAGISGGGTKATVYLYINGRRVCANDPRFGRDAANLWVGLTYLTQKTDAVRDRLVGARRVRMQADQAAAPATTAFGCSWLPSCPRVRTSTTTARTANAA